MKVIQEDGLPIKMWLDDLEGPALAQARNLARLPFARKWICLMPDAHMGYGMPIGGVLATRDVVIPNAVGVDIGCGMCFQATNIPVSALFPLLGIVGSIKQSVPVGFSSHPEKRPCRSVDMMRCTVEHTSMVHNSIGMDVLENAYFQVGTLGGGNHFIELQADEDDHLCIMLHSGSRNMGKWICDYYNGLACDRNKRWFSSVDPKWELSFLPLHSNEGAEYLAWMRLALAFAQENRERMMQSVLEIVLDAVGGRECISNLILADPINIHHNYAAMEHHFGENLVVHRKGATKATADTVGIIPGSMGTASYIVQGLGNPESFMSCSHGAGRRMGRKEATRTLSLDAELERMSGILHDMTEVSDLDEAPGAYKDIDVVMRNQEDLVRVVKKLRPIAVIKG